MASYSRQRTPQSPRFVNPVGRTLFTGCLGLALGFSACLPGLGPADPVLSERVDLHFWTSERDVGQLTYTDEVPWVWGFQGGTMIRPMLVFHEDAEIMEGDDFEIVIRTEVVSSNNNSSAFDPVFREYRNRFSAYRDVGQTRLMLGPIDHQLGWTSLEGLHMKFSVELTSFSGRIEREFQLVETLSYDACAPFVTAAESSPTCSYARLPGVAQVSELERTDFATTCEGDEATIRGLFTPMDEAATACLDRHLADGWPDPRVESLAIHLNITPNFSCLSENGMNAGAEHSATYQIRIQGSCTPAFQIHWEEDLSECACAQP